VVYRYPSKPWMEEQCGIELQFATMRTWEHIFLWVSSQLSDGILANAAINGFSLMNNFMLAQ
jgi:hypothetical protein